MEARQRFAVVLDVQHLLAGVIRGEVRETVRVSHGVFFRAVGCVPPCLDAAEWLAARRVADFIRLAGDGNRAGKTSNSPRPSS